VLSTPPTVVFKLDQGEVALDTYSELSNEPKVDALAVKPVANNSDEEDKALKLQ